MLDRHRRFFIHIWMILDFFGLILSKFGFLSKDIAVDLGTANTVIYCRSRGIVLNEPSMVAVINEKGFEVPYLFGFDAKLMQGKTPDKIIVHRPLRDGVIADFVIAEEMIRFFIKRANGSMRFIRPLIIICVPFDSTAVERRAIQDAAEKCGAKDVMLIEEPMAAAMGANLPVSEPTGSMVVDIGGGTTEIAVISLGGIVHGRSIKVGGNSFDDSIIQYVKQKYNLLIGEITAENLKKEIGIAYIPKGDPIKSAQIKGRDLVTGIPREITITQEDIVKAIGGSIYKIIDYVKNVLEISPPEISSDIVDRGIVLTGGGALLRNIDKIISDATGLPVFIAPNPLLCVANGVGKILEDHSSYSHILFKQI